MKGHSIQFIHSGKAILPELMAYKDYIQSRFEIDVSIEPRQHPSTDASIHWYIMGQAPLRTPPGIAIIHEYASLSTGRFPRLKNGIKRVFSAKPSHRIFLNEFVRDEMGFTDSVPAHLRDMGVWEGYFSTHSSPGSGRWFYAGAITRSRGMDKFLTWWKKQKDQPELVLCGPASAELVDEFSDCPSIQFKGRVSRERVAELASECEFGLNLLYDVYPLTGQTSTKVLEYCAMNLKIVTTHSRWIEAFVHDYACHLAYIDLDDMPPLHQITSRDFRNPDVSHYSWNSILDKARISEMIDHCLQAGSSKN